MAVRERVVLQGIAQGGENWSTGIYFEVSGGSPLDTQGAQQTWANEIAERLSGTGLGTSLLTTMGQRFGLTSIRTEHYPAVGPLAIAASAPCVANGTGVAEHPYPTCVVISALTGLAGGRNRGRHYWPAQGVSLSTGRLSSGVAAATATAWVSMIGQIQAAALETSTEVRPVVYSGAADLVTPVTSYRVGDVPDTQRRRRDALIETYSTVQLPQ